MDRRGGTSFAILFILNPIVILFYQNCSVLPVESKSLHNRQISSVQEPSNCRLVASKNCAE